jgi:ferrous iron transport protein B
VGSVILSLAEHFNIDMFFNQAVSPLTSVLGLPIEVGNTLLFGILRKELSMLMLMQALGTNDIGTVMSVNQLVVFTVFIVFYIPCLATIGVMIKEVGFKRTMLASLFTLLLATTLGVLVRIFLMFLGV